MFLLLPFDQQLRALTYSLMLVKTLSRRGVCLFDLLYIIQTQNLGKKYFLELKNAKLVASLGNVSFT